MSELPKCRLCDTSPAIYPMADGITVKRHCNNRECTLHNVLMTHDQWTALMGDELDAAIDAAMAKEQGDAKDPD